MNKAERQASKFNVSCGLVGKVVEIVYLLACVTVWFVIFMYPPFGFCCFCCGTLVFIFF